MRFLVLRAALCAAYWHGLQRDRRGRLYFFHLWRVAKAVRTPEQKAIAFLHDVLEDTPASRYSLLSFLVDVHAGVILLTRDTGATGSRPKTTYKNYIRHILHSNHSAAIAVKKADLQDNLDPRRRDGLTLSLLARYSDSLDTLNGVL